MFHKKCFIRNSLKLSIFHPKFRPKQTLGLWYWVLGFKWMFWPTEPFVLFVQHFHQSFTNRLDGQQLRPYPRTGPLSSSMSPPISLNQYVHPLFVVWKSWHKSMFLLPPLQNGQLLCAFQRCSIFGQSGQCLYALSWRGSTSAFTEEHWD